MMIYVYVSMISVLGGLMLASIILIAGRESDYKWFDDIPDDLKDRGH